MKSNFKLKHLTIIIFCIYIFWGSFGLDLTLNPDIERIPLHRAFILLTAFILLFNFQQVIISCLKNKTLISLILYVLLSTAWAYSPSETIKNFIFLSSIFFISVMTALAFSDDRTALIRWLFWLFLLMTIASIIAGLYFPTIGINTLDFGKPRWIGITAHPNGLGTQALTLIWLSSNLFFLSKSKIEKQIILLAIIAALYAIVKADSMTSLITSLVIITYSSYCYLLGTLKLPIKLTLAAITLLSLLVVITFYMSATELTTATIESTGRNTTFTGRSILWQNAFTAAADNLLFGYGFDDIEPLTKKYHILMSHLHNGYIEILVKGGVVACILLSFVLAKTFFKQLMIKTTNRNYFIFLNTGLVMILIHNITESSILRGFSTFSILLIFIIVSTNLITKNHTASPTGLKT